MAPMLTVTDVKGKIFKRGKYYRRVVITGTTFPPFFAPGGAVSITHKRTGLAVDVVGGTLIYGPTLIYLWGRIPHHAPTGIYNVTVNAGGGNTGTLLNAFRIS